MDLKTFATYVILILASAAVLLSITQCTRDRQLGCLKAELTADCEIPTTPLVRLSKRIGEPQQ